MTASLLNSLPNPENPDLEVIMQSVSYTIARPDSGAVLPYAVVTVFEQDGSTRASMFDAEGAGVGNPITADANGAVNFAAANGTYILRAVSADGLLTLPDLTVQVFDLQALANGLAKGPRQQNMP
ncbi:MAG: hypothetical protein B7Z34_02585 [Novosphingobium sp. 12-62-10]|nr:MAG: hypothetical protein B7Z34_02585 [Novosphingobium sp. 12-62-10]